MAMLMLVVQAAAMAANASLDLARVQPAVPTIGRCSDDTNPDGMTGEVVVCGERRRSYRLPLRAPRAMGMRARGEPAYPGDLLAGSGRCGIFAGERRCTSKAEAEEFGYGGGRDPITILGRVAAAVAGQD